MKFVIFHGSFGSKNGNWFPDLKSRLESLGQTVILSQFPVENYDLVTKTGEPYIFLKQNLNNWLKFFEKNILPQLDGKEKLCFVGHSLGPLFILHLVDKYKIKIDSAIFVSPFLDQLPNTPWQLAKANKTFFKTDFDFDRLKKFIPISYALCSDKDPYIPNHQFKLFAKAMDSSVIYVKNAGHLNAEVNLNEFPLVFDLCCSRINLPLYQKFLARRSQQQASEFIRFNKNKVLTLSPTEANDESRFHFMNLKNGGFCTLISSSTNLNPHDQYYEDGRKTAKNCDITRVIMVVNKTDLKRREIKEQIKCDLIAGIKVGLCELKDVKDLVGEYDFGLWDDEYICSIHYKNSKKQSEIILDGRHDSLEKARGWKDEILKHTTFL